MKNIKNKLAGKFAFIAFLTAGAFSVVSCSSKENGNGQELPDGTSQIIVNASSVADNETTVAKISKAGISTSNHQSVEMINGNGFDALIAVDQNLPKATTINNKGIQASAGNRAAALEPGTTFRVFLYKKVGVNYVYQQSHLLTTGTATPISVDNGSAYKWVALSYNNTDLIPDRGANDDFTLPQNKDVLYASSTTDFTTSDTPVPVTITFKRLFSRIGIELNTMGLFGTMNSATVGVSGQTVKTGTINLTTKAFVGPLTTGTTPTLAFGNFTNISDASQKIAYFYTADPTPLNIAVTIQNLVITLDDGNTRNFGTSTLSKTIPVTPELGKSHRLLVGIGESALTYGGVQWSRSNLFYKTGSTTPYRFNPSNLYSATIDQNSYFSFKGHIPRKLASGNPANQKDPCALVYPAGLWKTPSKPNLNAIQNREGILSDLLGSILDLIGLGAATPGAEIDNGLGGTNHYIQFTPTAGVHAAYGANTSPENKLRFNYNGLQTNVGLIEGLITLNLGTSKGNQAAFWTEDQGLDLLGLAGVGAWNYLGFSAGITKNTPKGTAGAGLLNIDLLNLNVVSSALMNVRCVRNPAWAAASQQPTYNPMPVL